MAISVILPVYNVSDYVDQCLNSLAHQTFDDFEALIVDDGSTDDSAEKCAAWCERDARFRLIRKPNGGVSSARNVGIEEARGTYLAFVDPDDWLDERYLEKLHAKAVETGADFVECDLWRYNNRTGSAIYRSCGAQMGVPFSLEEHMKYGPTASYKAISRRSLWIDNDVRFPAYLFESPAVYALVLALANRVENVPEALYWYRRMRENSLVETYALRDEATGNVIGVDAMKHLLREFERRGLSERFADVLPGVVAYRLNDILAMQHHRRNADEFAGVAAGMRAFLAEAFPNMSNAPYFTWGGYNLCKALTDMDRLHDPSCRFSFSSIASVVGDGGRPFACAHRNKYRQMMLARELAASFWDVLAAQQPAGIVLDLMGERFDLVECEGRILTKSDAFDEAIAQSDGALPPMRVIPRESEECTRIWTSACDEFFARIARIAPQTRIVVVESYLAERVGDLRQTREHEGIAAVRATNDVLAGYYRHIRETHPEFEFVDVHDDVLYFTDSAYEYGAIPSHLNPRINHLIAKRVEEVLP